MTSAMRGEVFHGNGLACRNDERLNGFASIQGPHSDDSCLTHMRMKHKHLLDLGWVHIQPRGRQDHVFLPIDNVEAVSYTHLRAHETPEHLVCRLLLEKKK